MPKKPVSDVADLDEVLMLLTEKARDGSVTAMASLLRHLERRQADDEQPVVPVGFAALDELASRRASR